MSTSFAPRHSRHGESRGRALRLGVAAALLGLVASLAVATPAYAAGALTVSKLVDGVESAALEAGDEFTYTISVGCDDEDCEDATLTDPLPAELEGFTILSTAVTPSAQPSSFAYTAGCGPTVTPGCALAVDFRQPMGATVGLQAGDTYLITVTLRVPQSLPADWDFNGDPVVNTATATSSSAATASDSATLTVDIPVEIAVDAGKTWSPASQQFSPGVLSTVTVTAANSGNVSADALVVQDPTAAASGAGSLAAANPFDVVDFVGFGAVTAPEGADQVQVEAYVFDGGTSTWGWVSGPQTALGAIALPAGVAPGDVAGLRFTFSDSGGLATIAPEGDAGSVAFQVAQRAERRTNGAALTLGTTVTNDIVGTILVAGDTATDAASAPYAITGLNVSVLANKTIAPARIPAGTSAVATVSAQNTSNGPVAALTLDEAAYFTEELRFGGFTSPLAFPTGATAATITWRYSGGTDSGPIAFASGSSPAAPAAPTGEHLTGFLLTYTGSIPTGQSVTAAFAISPTVAFVPVGAGSVSAPNTVLAGASNAAGSASDPDPAPLSVFEPDIDLDLAKTISPSGAVVAGGTVVAQLPATTSVDSAFLQPQRIVIDDVWRSGEADDLWNAFDATAIAPTQVPLGTTLRIQYTTNGVTWSDAAIVDGTSAAQIYQATLASLLPGGTAPADVRGLRFVFDAVAPLEAFPQGATVSPNVVFTARAQLRDGGGATAEAGEPATRYENEATAQGFGEVDGGIAVESDIVDATDDAGVIAYDGEGTYGMTKRWTPTNFSGDATFVSSQSGDRVGTRLDWAVRTSGFDSVTITDPAAGPGTPAATAFQAFDLVSIAPVSYATDAAMQWDRVSAVELYYGGGWHLVAAPAGGWMNRTTGGNAQRGFVGYTLTTTERAATTGVRITLVPDDVARAASVDPLTPPVGSGVASSPDGQSRRIGLIWELRNTVRTPGADGPWANADRTYNMPDEGVVSNAASLSGVRNSTPVTPVSASDTITLIDQPPAVDVVKTATPTTLSIPENDDVDPADYPTVKFDIVARNTAASRASYIRVTDPLMCPAGSLASCLSDPSDWDAQPFAGVYDPATNPFERVTLIDLAFTTPTGEVDRGQSMVTLWLWNGGSPIAASPVSITVADGYGPTQLADVVGVSVVYQGTDPETRGGSIDSGSTLTLAMTARVRPTLRSAPTVLVGPGSVPNEAFVQGYDPVLFPSGAASTPFDTDDASVLLLKGILDVTASKSITPAALIERDRANPVTVTLGATPGDSTVATQRVTIEDSDAEFWNHFRLTSLGTVNLPAGADRVRVDVQLDGDAPWILGTAGPTAVLPAVDLATVTGIRLVFDRADGGVFSASSPPASWSAQATLGVALLDELRSGGPVVFPTTVDDTVTTTSERLESPVLYPSASATADDSIALGTGTFRLDVAKSPLGNAHTVQPGESIPWTITFRNTGTGFLDVTDLVDSLPASLEFDGETPTYTGSAQGLLSTTPAYGYDAATRELTFVWPDGGARMAPGESFTVQLGIILVPGLAANDRATNQFVVTTEQPLAVCTNTSGNGQGTLSGLAAEQCGSSNYVQPTAGASLVTTKGSRGEIDGVLVDGATNLTNPAAPCVSDAQGFYRSPCAANSVIGATDEWKINAVNSGTVDYTTLTVVDPLPAPGDLLLATGGARGSTFRPVLQEGLQVTGAPDGTTVTWEVTTAANACWGTGTSWTADPTCSTHPAAAQWTAGDTFTGDWGAVTALRVTFNFSNSTQGVLRPGGAVEVRYQTVNEPRSATRTQGASVAVPQGEQVAWNQSGAVATLVAGAPIRRAPVKAGVILPAGPLAISKVVTGDAAAFAGDSYLIDLACTVEGVALELGADAVLELTTPSLLARVDGVPLGAECTAAEQGPVGTFGETRRDGNPVVLDILTAAGPLDAVPTAQQGAITNVFEFGGLSITKQVETAATTGAFGPFTFTLVCESALGDPVPLPAGDAAFSLADGQTHTVAAGVLPVGAECVLTESDADAADSVAITGSGVDDEGDGSATVTVGSASAVTVVNRYEAGTLAVLKTVQGNGGADYGTGPFAANVRCEYGTPTQVLYENAALPIVPDVPTVVPGVFPAGTECAVSETLTGGATDHVDPPSVTIVGGAVPGEVGAVTAGIVNTFRVGSLEIVKERVGDGVDLFGDGPFTVNAVCTWDRDGTTVTIPLPDGGDLVLDASNGYRGTIEALLIGAECVVTEPDAGLATATTFAPTGGRVTVLDPTLGAGVATVVVTNTFDIGRLEIAKTPNTTSITSGGEVTYTLAVTNIGQIDATDVTVIDTLPAGATVVATSGGGVVTGGEVQWIIPSVRVGETSTVTVTVRLTGFGTVVNHARVELPTGPWEPSEAPECEGEEACAPVELRTLALTGSTPLTELPIAVLLLGLGSLLIFGRRRRGRHA